MNNLKSFRIVLYLFIALCVCAGIASLIAGELAYAFLFWALTAVFSALMVASGSPKIERRW